jgi:hypothetical protein
MLAWCLGIECCHVAPLAVEKLHDSLDFRGKHCHGVISKLDAAAFTASDASEASGLYLFCHSASFDALSFF